MATRTHRLSKSRFVAGLQCHRLLWWRTHERGAPELVPDASLQARFDGGNEVGARAREQFPGGVLMPEAHIDFAAALAATRDALDRGEQVIYEAAFEAEGVFAAVDVLHRGEHGWVLTEVKSSTSAKLEHIHDASVQTFVLRACGLEVERIEIMHLNRDCTYPDLSDLFQRDDVTLQVEAFLPQVPGLVAAQLAMLDGELPAARIGPHCDAPYECPFQNRCWADVPEHHVTELYWAGRKAWEYANAGITTIDALPDSALQSAVARRQVESVRSGRRILVPGITAKLDAFAEPVAVLDFETIPLAVPRFAGCHPYAQLPVQFSVQRRGRSGAWEESGYLAQRGGDPRPELAIALVRAVEGAETVLAYNVGFEKSVIVALAEAVPAHRAALLAIVPRLQDLLPVVRDHVYDPAFHGSFSIKAVLPVLVPGLGYSELIVAEGGTASAWLADLLLGANEYPPEEVDRRRAALLAYCARDTEAVVRLMEALRALESAA